MKLNFLPLLPLAPRTPAHVLLLYLCTFIYTFLYAICRTFTPPPPPTCLCYCTASPFCLLTLPYAKDLVHSHGALPGGALGLQLSIAYSSLFGQRLQWFWTLHTHMPGRAYVTGTCLQCTPLLPTWPLPCCRGVASHYTPSLPVPPCLSPLPPCPSTHSLPLLPCLFLDGSGDTWEAHNTSRR